MKERNNFKTLVHDNVRLNLKSHFGENTLSEFCKSYFCSADVFFSIKSSSRKKIHLPMTLTLIKTVKVSKIRNFGYCFWARIPGADVT